MLGAPLGIGRTAEVYAWGEGQILKLYRAETPASWARLEFDVGRIVTDAGLAAPGMRGLIEVNGRAGIVCERIQGPSMLDALARRPWVLPRSAHHFAEVHAAMHACHRPQLPSQRATLQHQIQHAPRLSEAARGRALAALDRLPDGDAVCHGDYHPDNLLVTARGPVVIDWMTATHGNPAADVARTILLFQVGVLPEGMSIAKRVATEMLRRAFLRLYLRSYRGLLPVSEAEIQAWTPVLAAARLNEHIPAEEETLLELAEKAG